MEEQKTLVTQIGKLLPDLFAVFDLPELGVHYVNPAGFSWLDANGTADMKKLSLYDIIGVNDIDRFRQQIFLQLSVHRFWTGSLKLRDMLGSEYLSKVHLLEVPGPAQNQHQLFLYATLPQKSKTEAESSIADEDMLHALLETLPSQVYFKNITGRYLRISRVKADKHGLTDPRDSIGKTDFDYYTAEHAAPAFQDEKRIMMTGQPVIDLEEKETFSDGSVCWVSTTKLPFYNRAGVLIGTFGISRDITKQKIAAQQLRMLSRAIEQSPISIIITDTEGKIEYVNPYFEKITGYSAAEAVGRNPRILKSETHPAEFYKTLWDQLSAGHEWNGEIQNRRKNGELFWERASISALRNDLGKTTHYIAVKEDVTDRKKVEEAQLESEALFRAVFSGSSDAILLVSDNKILDCNARSVEMFGWPKEELLKLHPVDLSPPAQPDGRDSLSAAKEVIGLAIKNGHWQFEWMHRRRDNTDFPTEVVLSSFEFRGKLIVHGTVRDISEKKKAEADRIEMESRLQLTSKLESVGSLAAGVAHEVNTPTQFISDNVRFLTGAFSQLNAILGSHRKLFALAAAHPECAQALNVIKATEVENELDYLTNEIPRCLEQSMEGLKRIGKIVGSLKEFSHPSGEEKSYADLNRAIETTVAVSKHEWKYVADLVTELDPSLPKVHCLIDEINQAVLNLIVNASHATEDANKLTGAVKGLITIRSRKEADNAIIEVQDTGTGIPEHVRDRIFEPFYTTKPVGRGTGQGLAIVQAVIVKKHHGKISFTTEIGKGTTFRLSLPLSPISQGSTHQSWSNYS